LSNICQSPRSSDEKDLAVAVFQAAISNAFIPRALKWAIAILDLGSNGRMGKNYASAQRAESATAQGIALGINALRFGSLKDCNCQTFFIRRSCANPRALKWPHGNEFTANNTSIGIKMDKKPAIFT
jgi:hypothetical protein